MAFGKVAVQDAGGEVVEYELTRPTTSIGRQPGNDIVLPTSSVSRYHAQFDVAEGRIFLVDLGTVNGTFVNDRMMEPGSRVALEDGDLIQIGDMRIRFSGPEARSGSKRAALSLETEARPVEAAGLPFRLILDEPQQSVAPGARLQLALIIENLADHEYPVTIAVGGLNPDWVKLNRSEAALEPHEQTQAIISVRPPRTSATSPGIYPLTVRVAHRDDPSQALEAVREIDIVGYAGLGMAVQPGRAPGAFQIAVQNQGNVPASIMLEGFQHGRTLRFRFQPHRLSLPPGETRQVALTVQPVGGRPFGRAREVRFAVVARSLDRAGYRAPISLSYTLRPSWPAWLAGIGAPILLGAAAVVIGLVAVLIYLKVLPWPFGLLMPDRPVAPAVVMTDSLPAMTLAPADVPTLLPTPVASIESFTADPPEVIYRTDEMLRLNWKASGAREIILIGADGAPLPLSAVEISTGQYVMSIGDLPLGQARFTLTVIGEDGQERTRTLDVPVSARICSVSSTAQAFTQPDEAAALALPFESDQVIIVGRTSDSRWLRIAYNDPDSLAVQGWIAADQVTCPPGSPPLDAYLPLQGAPGRSPGASTPAPTGTP